MNVERQTEDKQSWIHSIQSTPPQSHNLGNLLLNPPLLSHTPFTVQTDQDRHVCIARGGYVCTRSLSHICRDSEGHPNSLLTAPFHMTACTTSDQGLVQKTHHKHHSCQMCGFCSYEYDIVRLFLQHYPRNPPYSTPHHSLHLHTYLIHRVSDTPLLLPAYAYSGKVIIVAEIVATFRESQKK
jgi:hypothetical protein